MRKRAQRAMWYFPMAIVLSLMDRADSASDLIRAARSPFDIERFIQTDAAFEWEPLWKALQIKEHIFLPRCEEWGGPMPACTSELIAVTDPPQTILLLHHEPSMFAVFLRFSRESNNGRTETWRFAGCYQPNVKYFSPHHRRIVFANKPYLLIVEQGNAGSGLFSKVETWLDLTVPIFEPVFAYTVSGHKSDSPPGVHRSVTGMIVSSHTDPIERIHVRYTIDFSTEEHGVIPALGQKTDTAVYARVDGRFVLDEKLSTTTQKQINALYEDLDSNISNEDVLRFSFASLREIAVTGNAIQKQWLQSFLTRCHEGPETKTLRALLKRPAATRPN